MCGSVLQPHDWTLAEYDKTPASKDCVIEHLCATSAYVICTSSCPPFFGDRPVPPCCRAHQLHVAGAG